MPKKKESNAEGAKKSQKEKAPLRTKGAKGALAKTKEKTEQERPTPELQPQIGTEEHKPVQDDFYIAAIGASAGGLEALEQFFKNMPPDSGIAFVVIPHLAPDHESAMPELLQRYTKMEVVEADKMAKVIPDRVYVIPPNSDMTILQNRLHLSRPSKTRGYRHPIDIFFRSLAEDRMEKSIGIVLSGTGSEGAVGLRHIKGEGGLALSQDLKTARYSGMPESAIGTGVVDKVLPPENMPEFLLEYIKYNHPLEERKKQGEEEAEKGEDNLRKIFGLIRSRSGHDFSLYKRNTIQRRIEKRLAIHQMKNVSDYIKYLRSNPHEIDALLKELLIRVTGFFRDRDAFEALRQKVLPDLCRDMDKDEMLRVWVPGCSTGEEAYSIGILLRETMEEMDTFFNVQIFATDIDEASIGIARRGIYPDTISADVSPERLEKFFRREDSSYRVRNDIREMLVFSVQNLAKDPPFRRMDLVSCRNVLIYMNTKLQKRLIPVFRYALRPGGILFLGTSENIGEHTDIFTPVDKKWRIFKAKGEKERLGTELLDIGYLPHKEPVKEERAPEPKTPTTQGISEEVEKLLLDHYSPSSVLVNERGHIIYFFGKTGNYLEPSTGRATLNISEMAREGLKLELMSAIRKASNSKNDISVVGVQVKQNGDYRTVNFRVKYVKKPESLEGLMMIIFEEPRVHEGKPGSRRKQDSKKAAQDIAELEYELKSTKEHLQTTVEELETSNEELQSSNEELQSSNEELQSTNEELETSREELQSLNEELFTVNTELQEKNEELTRANNDMNNLLASTEVATIFLDRDLKIQNFTPSTKDVISIIDGDVGRPVGDLASKLDYPGLVDDVSEVLDKLVRKEKAVRHQGGRWFRVRMMPYRTVDDEIAGAIITFMDITELKNTQEALQEALIDQCVLQSVPEPLLVLDRNLRVVRANEAFYKTFKVKPAETEKKFVFDLGNGQWNIPALKKLIGGITAEDESFKNYKVELKFPGIGRKKMLISGKKIAEGDNTTGMVVLSIRDVTERG